MQKLSASGLASLCGILAIAWATTSIADAPSAADCAAEADRAVRDVGSGVGGIAKGATKGALFGAIVGNKKSAKRGAALGSIVGGVRRTAERNDVYESVYDACMRRR
jgi:hypothetical protein